MAADETALRASGDLLNDFRAVLRRSDWSPCSDQEISGGEGVREGDVLLLLQPLRWQEPEPAAEMMATAWAEVVLGQRGDSPLPVANEATETLELLRRLEERNFSTSTRTLARGGLALAIAAEYVGRGFGFHLDLTQAEGADAHHALFGERPQRAVVSARPKAHLPLANFAERHANVTAEAIGRVTREDLRVRWQGETVLEISRQALLDSLR